jgi:hypothetical protein
MKSLAEKFVEVHRHKQTAGRTGVLGVLYS